MKGKFAVMEKQRQEEEKKRMEGERKRREAQDNMEKAKIKKELAQKAAEVSGTERTALQGTASTMSGKWDGMSWPFSSDPLIRGCLYLRRFR